MCYWRSRIRYSDGSAWQLLTSPVQGGAVYTAYIAGTTTKLFNNQSGKVDFTFDNAVNSVSGINAALANIQNITNIGSTYGGGWVELTPGVYRRVSTVKMTMPEVGIDGIGLVGKGRGTVLNIVPGSALTHGIEIDIQHARLSHMTIDANPNVTNLVRIVGNQASGGGQGAYGFMEDVWFEGDDPQTSGQIGILHEGATGWPYHWSVDNVFFQNLYIGIKHTGTEATSMKVSNLGARHCLSTFADVGGGQNFYNNGFVQGSPEECHTGFLIRATGDGVNIHNVMTEISNTSGSLGTANSVILESGANLCEITNVSNFLENGSTVKTLTDNSQQGANRLEYRRHFAAYSRMNKLETQEIFPFSGESISIPIGAVDLGNAVHIELHSTSGSMISTTTTDKLGFFGTVPRTQRPAIASPTVDVTSLKTAVDQIRMAIGTTSGLGFTAGG